MILNAGLTENMFEGLQDLCSSQICLNVPNLLQSLIHVLLGVRHTFTDIIHSTNNEKRCILK